MFGTWATASDAEVAEALRFARVVEEEDVHYSPDTLYGEDAAEAYECAGRIPEQHEHHHINATA